MVLYAELRKSERRGLADVLPAMYVATATPLAGVPRPPRHRGASWGWPGVGA